MNIDERLEVIGRRIDELTKIHLDTDRQYLARFEAAEARMAAHDERMAAADERALAAEERHDGEMLAIPSELRHAVRLSIQEGRAERGKRRELDEKITQLAAAQLVTEEKLQRFLERSGNGKP